MSWTDDPSRVYPHFAPSVNRIDSISNTTLTRINVSKLIYLNVQLFSILFDPSNKKYQIPFCSVSGLLVTWVKNTKDTVWGRITE